MTDEIRDVVSQGGLPAKAETFDAVRLDVPPQQRLGTRHPLAEVLRSPPPTRGEGTGRVCGDPPPPGEGGAQSRQRPMRVKHAPCFCRSTIQTQHLPRPPRSPARPRRKPWRARARAE